VNQLGECKWWQFWLRTAFAGIQSYQKSLFGKDSNWQDVHTMLYFSEGSTFSVEPPRATFKSLSTYYLSSFSIYRLRLLNLASDYIDSLKRAADRIYGTPYDYGQLIDIAVNKLLEYSDKRHLRIFDFGRKMKVCSVGVRAAFEYLYKHRIRTESSLHGKWLFHAINPNKWPPEFIRKFQGTNVETTSPAHFANSDYFSNEFELVGKFKYGKRIFPG
jgi:hypothetical protein